MTGRRLFADTRPLRESPAFRRLWIGSSLSSIGSRMTSFATALQIYELTHSSAAVGALALVLGVPTTPPRGVPSCRACFPPTSCPARWRSTCFPSTPA